MNERERKLSALSVQEKRSCTAHWVDGLTHAQIGRGEYLSKWASMKRLQRARRKLAGMGLGTPQRKAAFRTPAFQLGTVENI